MRHAITVDGPVTREKVGRILDLVEAMSGPPRASATALGFSSRKLDRLASSILSHLKDTEFTSGEAKKMFEKTFSEKIPLSTVSTYLSRLADRGVLERLNEGARLHYKVTLEQALPVHALHPPSPAS